MAIIFPTALAATPVHPPNRGSRWALYCKPASHMKKSAQYIDLAILIDLTSLAGTAAGITWTWVNEVNRHDQEKRAYVSALVRADVLLGIKAI